MGIRLILVLVLASVFLLILVGWDEGVAKVSLLHGFILVGRGKKGGGEGGEGRGEAVERGEEGGEKEGGKGMGEVVKRGI